ncbi:MAG TPA: polyphenol oxidase family protein [Gemmatimonadaceae bacterium]|nr:polyphenol oxidase family protein [Gemmatimonadaceae bacterium]
MTAAGSSERIPLREKVESFASIGIEAFTTTRVAGDFGLGDGEPPAAAVAKWVELQAGLAAVAPRLASAKQVHGTKILEHGVGTAAGAAAAGDHGWTRHNNADGHITFAPGVALAVQIADCVPVFVAHPSGAVALLHAGWRGTAGKILQHGISRMVEHGLDAVDLKVHFGPAICGRCYEVGPDTFEQLTGWQTIRNRNVDLRALLSEQAKEMGVRQLTASPHCTKCDNDRFFSHRAGDAARQVAVIISAVESKV